MLDHATARQRFVGYVHGGRRWPEGSLCGSISRLRSRRSHRHVPGPFRIRVFQQNLGYIQIYPDISVGIFSPSNVRAKRKTLLESSPHAQALRGKTDEHKMLLRAGCLCLQKRCFIRIIIPKPLPPTTSSTGSPATLGATTATSSLKTWSMTCSVADTPLCSHGAQGSRGQRTVVVACMAGHWTATSRRQGPE